MDSSENVRRQIVEIVAEVAQLPVEQIAPDALLADLDIDSLRGLRIVAAVERRWKIVIGEDEIGRIRSMTDVFALVEGRTDPA